MTYTLNALHKKVKFLVIIFSALFCTHAVVAQQLLSNGDFNNTTANWVTSCSSVEAVYYETTYGGTDPTNHVAEVDDESCFHQDICVFPGDSYIFSMDASRRTAGSPNPITTTITIDGLDAGNNVVANYVTMDFTRTNTVWGLTPVTGIPIVTVPIGPVVRLRVTLRDNTPGYSTLGMIVDNLSLTFVTPPAITLTDTVCQYGLDTFSVANLPPSGITYKWTFSSHATISSDTDAVVYGSYDTVGLQPIVCILGNGSCSVDTVLENVFVGGSPSLPVVVSPLKYCFGDTTTILTATGTFGSTLHWFASFAADTSLPGAPLPPTDTPGTTTWYVSQITLGGCISGKDSISVIVSPPLGLDFTVKDISCYGEKNGILNVNALSGTLPFTFTIQPGGSINQSGTFSGLDTGSYIVLVSDSSNLCKGKLDDIMVTQPQPLSIRDSITTISPTCLKDANGSIIVSAFGGTYSYIYQLDSINLYTMDGNFTGLYADNYILEVRDSHGCKVTKAIELTADRCCKVFFPSAFTPNNDGKNDRYKAMANSAIRGLDLHIYNRYGQEVYHGYDGRDGGWDGTYNNEPAAIDTYFYMATYFCEDVNEEYTEKGNITLIR